jgi:hypothetical protein
MDRSAAAAAVSGTYTQTARDATCSHWRAPPACSAATGPPATGAFNRRRAWDRIKPPPAAGDDDSSWEITQKRWCHASRVQSPLTDASIPPWPPSCSAPAAQAAPNLAALRLCGQQLVVGGSREASLHQQAHAAAAGRCQAHGRRGATASAPQPCPPPPSLPWHLHAAPSTSLLLLQARRQLAVHASGLQHASLLLQQRAPASPAAGCARPRGMVAAVWPVGLRFMQLVTASSNQFGPDSSP